MGFPAESVSWQASHIPSAKGGCLKVCGVGAGAGAGAGAGVGVDGEGVGLTPGAGCGCEGLALSALTIRAKNPQARSKNVS